jgi:hypothetical protein
LIGNRSELMVDREEVDREEEDIEYDGTKLLRDT